MAKSPDAFRTISEVAEWLDVPAHVLRFWESRFSQVKPVKRAGGRRYYRRADIELLDGIRRLLHDDGMTIRGVQKLLREDGVKAVSALARSMDDPDGPLAPGEMPAGETWESEVEGIEPVRDTAAPVAETPEPDADAMPEPAAPQAAPQPPVEDDEAPMAANVEPPPLESQVVSFTRPRSAETAPPATPAPDRAEPAAPRSSSADAPRAANPDVPPDPEDDDPVFSQPLPDLSRLRRDLAELRPIYDRLTAIRARLGNPQRPPAH